MAFPRKQCAAAFFLLINACTRSRAPSEHAPTPERPTTRSARPAETFESTADEQVPSVVATPSGETPTEESVPFLVASIAANSIDLRQSEIVQTWPMPDGVLLDLVEGERRSLAKVTWSPFRIAHRWRLPAETRDVDVNEARSAYVVATTEGVTTHAFTRGTPAPSAPTLEEAPEEVRWLGDGAFLTSEMHHVNGNGEARQIGPEGGCGRIVVSPDERWALCENGETFCVPLAGGPARRLEGRAFGFLPSGHNVLADLGDGRAAAIWDPESGQTRARRAEEQLQTVRSHRGYSLQPDSDAFRSLADIIPLDDERAVRFREGRLHPVRLHGPPSLRSVPLDGPLRTARWLSPESMVLGFDGSARIERRATTGTLEASWSSPCPDDSTLACGVFALEVSPDGAHILAEVAPHGIVLLDSDTLQPVSEWPTGFASLGPDRFIYLDDDGNAVARGIDGAVIFQLPVEAFPDPPPDAFEGVTALSASSEGFALGFANGTVLLFNEEGERTGRLRARGFGEPKTLAWLPGPCRIAVGFDDTARVFRCNGRDTGWRPTDLSTAPFAAGDRIFEYPAHALDGRLRIVRTFESLVFLDVVSTEEPTRALAFNPEARSFVAVWEGPRFGIEYPRPDLSKTSRNDRRSRATMRP